MVVDTKPIGSMKVRHLDVFQDRRRGFVCKAPDITDAVMPRTTLAIAGSPVVSPPRPCNQKMP